MKNFFIVAPFETSFEYFYILDNIRSKFNIDITINALLNNNDPNLKIDLSRIPIDNVYDITKEIPILSDNIVIAGSDSGLEIVNQHIDGKKVRHKKSLYLDLINVKHKIEHFHIDVNANNNIKDSIDWAQSRYPVVIKPTDGTGSRGVYSIYSEIELRSMLTYLFNEHNLTEYIVQKKVFGQEYQIDLTTDGQTVGIVAIWSVTRGYRSYSWLENFEDLSPLIQQSIMSIVSSLKEVDKLYGIYHVETIFDGTELKIIEINFRNHGHIPQLAYKSCVGWGHIESDIISHIWPTLWKNTFSNRILPRKKFLARAWIKNFRTRYIDLDQHELKLKIPSITKIYGRSDLYGKIVDPHCGFFSTHVAAVIMEHEDDKILLSEVDNLFRWAEERYML